VLSSAYYSRGVKRPGNNMPLSSSYCHHLQRERSSSYLSTSYKTTSITTNCAYIVSRPKYFYGSQQKKWTNSRKLGIDTIWPPNELFFSCLFEVQKYPFWEYASLDSFLRCAVCASRILKFFLTQIFLSRTLPSFRDMRHPLFTRRRVSCQITHQPKPIGFHCRSPSLNLTLYSGETWQLRNSILVQPPNSLFRE